MRLSYLDPSGWCLNLPTELQLLRFQSLMQVLHQLRWERPVTAMHLHHEVPSVHGSVECNFPETVIRRALLCLWDNPCLIKGSQEVCSCVKKFQIGGEIQFCLTRQLSITPPCCAFRAHSRFLAWLASLQPEISSSLTSGDHCSHTYVFLFT